MKLLPILFALATALCWGSYGPALGKARNVDPTASAMKPYLAIGGAYLVWAILGGAIGMLVLGDSFKLTGATEKRITKTDPQTGAETVEVKTGNAGRSLWLAFVAGSLGAIGALTLTLAMTTGGAKMPHVVMPVVFGGAVTVSAIVSSILQPQEKQNPYLWMGIAGILICTVIVAMNTPHAGPAHKKEQPAEQSTHSQPLKSHT